MSTRLSSILFKRFNYMSLLGKTITPDYSDWVGCVRKHVITKMKIYNFNGKEVLGIFVDNGNEYSINNIWLKLDTIKKDGNKISGNTPTLNLYSSFTIEN